MKGEPELTFKAVLAGLGFAGITAVRRYLEMLGA